MIGLYSNDRFGFMLKFKVIRAMSELKINSNNGFLQMEDLPQNCIFNKVVTGCGGTTVALFNKHN